MFACICRGVTVADVHRAGAAGITAADRLIAVLQLDDRRCCGRCRQNIGRFVEMAHLAACDDSADEPVRDLAQVVS
jgi:bacterioferritin-associated ferredoxin